MIPSKLYRLAALLDQGDFLNPVFPAPFADTVAAAVLSPNEQIPAEKALLLFSASVESVPDSTQRTTRMYIELVNPNQTFVRRLAARTDTLPAGNGIRANLDWSGWIIVPPSWRVGMTAEYSGAPVVGHSCNTSFVGVLIPRGNIVRVA